MNIRTINQPRVRPIRIRLSSPVYLWLALVLSAAIVGEGTVAMLTQENTLANPFSNYDSILPGQPRSAVIAAQFSCQSSKQSEYCTRAPAEGPFSLVSVILREGVVRRNTFVVRTSGLVVGDLALLWGRPHIRRYGHSFNFEWQNAVTAMGGAKNGRFSYHLPVWVISLGDIVDLKGAKSGE